MTNKPNVGVAGLGIMGFALATRLLEASVPLFVYNRTRERAAPLVATGATFRGSPSELAQSVEVAIVMVSDDSALFDVVGGAEGLLSSRSELTTIVNMSTVSIESTLRVAADCEKAGVHFVDSPVSGSKPQAETGKLILLASGEADVVESLRPIFDVLGMKTIYAGGAGNGTRLKLAVNLVLAHLAGALSEGLVFCEAAELDPRLLIEVLGSAQALNAGYFQGKGEKSIARDWTPQFPLKHMLKDIRLAQRVDPDLPIAAVLERLFESAAKHGHAEDDLSALLTALER
jgi:3-hydroxyisobutyrate dehydrogenase-like beta-hydroxyacid dehydrogenase